MKLWSGVLSPFSAKVRIVLAEKGLEHEILEVPWTRENLWGPKPAEFLAVSPRGQVPVLIDGDLALYDSTVIVEYLEDRYPEPALRPRDPGQRALCRLLEDDADQALMGPVTALVQEVFSKPDESSRDARRVEGAVAELRQYYGGLDKRLGDAPYLCGAFGVADVAAFLVAGFASAMSAPPPAELARLGAWVGRVGGRPTVASQFQQMTQAAAEA